MLSLLLIYRTTGNTNARVLICTTMQKKKKKKYNKLAYTQLMTKKGNLLNHILLKDKTPT